MHERFRVLRLYVYKKLCFLPPKFISRFFLLIISLLLTLKTLMKLCIDYTAGEAVLYKGVLLLYSSVEESAPRVFLSCRNSNKTCSSPCFALYNMWAVFYMQTLFQVTHYMSKTFLIYYIELWEMCYYIIRSGVLSLAIKSSVVYT